MEIIGVIDLKDGQAVHARGGRRESYLPVQRVAGATIAPGDAETLARAYVERLGIGLLYVADLDAIGTGEWHDDLVRRVAGIAPIWLDAGIARVDQVHRALALGATRVVIGLETLPSFERLATLVECTDASRLIFSLDTRDGHPVARGALAAMPSDVIARRAAACGVAAMIVLDLARVGMGRGPDHAHIARLAAALPRLLLVAGGGVAGPEDLSALADAGCGGALVASALLDGRVTRQHVDAISRRDVGVVHPRAAADTVPDLLGRRNYE